MELLQDCMAEAIKEEQIFAILAYGGATLILLTTIIFIWWIVRIIVASRSTYDADEAAYQDYKAHHELEDGQDGANQAN
ncbi:unnamed protein product [Trichogramma brassicae]|uniref:Uncharacterized protein n=1 Tax=Trichogramma brassicae TaxID=86971 RepID=A0A6H5ICV7_9HYME|nr:unnamed protein product [Trichogramma brassicae]